MTSIASSAAEYADAAAAVGNAGITVCHAHKSRASILVGSDGACHMKVLESSISCNAERCAVIIIGGQVDGHRVAVAVEGAYKFWHRCRYADIGAELEVSSVIIPPLVFQIDEVAPLLVSGQDIWVCTAATAGNTRIGTLYSDGVVCTFNDIETVIESMRLIIYPRADRVVDDSIVANGV